jgi:PKHD-type hydroxylase
MALQSVWFFTGLPSDIINSLEKDLEKHFDDMGDSKLINNVLDEDIRKSKNTWIPTTHWITGWLWHYVQAANRNNFLYDISFIESESMQYARYGVGEYYHWHSDTSIPVQYKPQIQISATESTTDDNYLRERAAIKNELVRKISFSLQLSDPDDYEGGNIQFIDESNQNYIAPRQKGSLIIFDSRTKHRVCKVRSGVRKSIVGWVVGPRWK